MPRSRPLKAPALLRPHALVYLYRRRLRVHAAQELLAGLGVAVAVALLFAVTVANGSIVGSAQEVVRSVVGPATLQLRARNGDGFDGRMLARVERLPGVAQAAPLLEHSATIVGPRARRVTVDVAGTNVSFAIMNGLAHTLPIAALSPGGIGLSRASAEALGVPASGGRAGRAQRVLLQLRGRAYPLRITAVLGPRAFGAPLSNALVAVMPLGGLQRLAGLPGRITRILVEPEHGREAAVRAGLQALAAGRLTVAAADQDVASLRQALHPSDQASALFAAISALLGFLFAFNAMLLTVPERRQAIADLRLSGTRRSAVVQMVLFQALCLGVLASLAGLAGGYALSRGVFHQSPGYLARAFTLGTSTVVGALPVLLAFAGGVLATCLASIVPLLDLRRGRALDAARFKDRGPGDALGQRTQRRLLIATLCLLVPASVLFALVPAAALVACVELALATVLAVPLVFAGALHLAGGLVERYQRLTVLPVALTSLRATTLRSLALAATGALALFGSVALGGSRDDLLRGIGTFARSYTAGADIWVVSPDDNQATVDFQPEGPAAARIARLPGVTGVHTFQGSFLDLGARRAWIIAWPPAARLDVLDGQVIDGTVAGAAARLREGGWIAVSAQIAAERDVAVGDMLTLPTPTGAIRFKVAATTTNDGWSPGAILMSTADYSRAWGSQPTALGVDVKPGANIPALQGAITRELGFPSGLEVLTAHAREAKIVSLAGEGLGQLGEISTLLILAAVLAMAAGLGSSIWQRRAALAGLRLSGAKPDRLRRILLVESALMLSAGCLTGALVGVYGQVVIDGYLKHVTGFPVASFAANLRPLEILAFAILAALLIVAVPGWFASQVSPALALDE